MKQQLNESKRLQELAGIQMNEIFGTSPEKADRRLEDALGRWVKYHMEAGKDEKTVKDLAAKFVQDAIDVHLGGKIDSDELDDMWDDVSSKM